MCGIAGIIYKDIDKKPEAAEIKKITDTLYHRGPDGEGFFIGNNAALGHRRLSIIDLETGDQPMHSFDGRFVIIYNGEIYNYIELRDELKSHGYKFHTTSDTEVLLNAYHKWGEDCQRKLNGMWAFAIWDKKEKKLFLSRDRIGEKPLFYAIQNDRFLFASEIKSILASGSNFEINYDVIELYLGLGYVSAPFTFYKNIFKLEPGCYLTVGNNDVRKFRYWDLPAAGEEEMQNDKKFVEQKFEELFYDSVRIRLRSDVPFGAFLSGGLDSSSIVAVMSEILNLPVETFTIGFNEKEYDESNLARLTSQKFKTNHHELIIKPEIFDTSLEHIVNHFDEPFGDSSAIPTGLVSKFASTKVKMVLTGDGGDEVFSGYTMYQGEKIAQLINKFPKKVTSGLVRSLGKKNSILSKSLSQKGERVYNVLSSSLENFNDRLISKSSWVKKDILKSLTENFKDRIKIEDFFSDVMNNCPYKDNFYKIMYFNFKVSLPDDMLVKVDRMSMAYSLETRAPFLDYRLIEFMSSVHKDIKMRKLERKVILKNTIGKKLPKELLTASKRGFNIPLKLWFGSNEFESRLSGLKKLSASGLPFNSIEEILEEIKTGNIDLGNFIWMLFILKRWLEKNTENEFQPVGV